MYGLVVGWVLAAVLAIALVLQGIVTRKKITLLEAQTQGELEMSSPMGNETLEYATQGELEMSSPRGNETVEHATQGELHMSSPKCNETVEYSTHEYADPSEIHLYADV